MDTKECKNKKYCCLYVSDFHLEMILLPYIKNKIKTSNIIILTENNLSDSVKTVLDRMNLNNEDKKIMKNINWNNEDLGKIDSTKENNIIVNGSKKFIAEKMRKINELKFTNINTIECYNISKTQESKINFEKEFDGILNTNNNPL